MEDPKKPYDINLGRFKNHQKVFPWMFLIKIILALGLIAFIYYSTQQLFEKEEIRKRQERQQQQNEIEVEIAE